MIENSNNIILNRTIEFSLSIISYTEKIEELKKYVIAKQLLRAGTSIGANVHEAQDAESKTDFIHKLKIAIKELNETKYWLVLCMKSENYPNCESLIEQIKMIERILNKIISTSKNKLKQNI
jgi:four helix bundle protein